MIASVELGAENLDDAVDDQIAEYLNPHHLRSFFLYAGAGSGKTRSLVAALVGFRKLHGDAYGRAGKRIAVITYTNAACDEIISRVDQDLLFSVSTIHSFCWAQIRGLHNDIRTWLRKSLPDEIAELEAKQAKGRPGKASDDRARSIAAKSKRLEWLSVPRRFTYDPDGDNYGRDSLGHTEVLKIASDFLQTKPAMQTLLTNQFPILLVDESQDTSRYLIEALLALEEQRQDVFALGLFGDTMQRIYPDGEPCLANRIPDRWAKPEKVVNHRSPQRIVALGNRLRTDVDGHQQRARKDSAQGLVRLFVVNAGAGDKYQIEQAARQRMAECTGDELWLEPGSSVKTLTLEHHMAAERVGFPGLFEALDRDFSVGLRNGTLAGTRFFSEQVAPLIEASSRHDKFAVMAVLRKHSPILQHGSNADTETADPLATARAGVDALLAVDTDDSKTTFFDVLQCVAQNNLLEIPESLRPFSVSDRSGPDPSESGGELDDDEPSEVSAWRRFMETPYCQIHPYADYIAERGAFATHQGVKGQEFDRVLIVVDDGGARGFMFSYEKLLGAKALSDNDRKKMGQGEETGIDRTRRLFYVTCTRAGQSLALVAYTDAPDALAEAVTLNGWFDASELERL